MKEPLREIAAELRRCADALEKGADGEGKLGTAVCHHCGREFSNWHNTCPDCGALAPGVYSYRISPAPNATTPKPVVWVADIGTKGFRNVYYVEIDAIVLEHEPLPDQPDWVRVEACGTTQAGNPDASTVADPAKLFANCLRLGVPCPVPVLHLTATCGEKLEVPVDEVRRVIACRSHDHDGTLCASKTIVRRTGKREVLGWECREPADVVRKMCLLCGRNVAPREVGSGE